MVREMCEYIYHQTRVLHNTDQCMDRSQHPIQTNHAGTRQEAWTG